MKMYKIMYTLVHRAKGVSIKVTRFFTVFVLAVSLVSATGFVPSKMQHLSAESQLPASVAPSGSDPIVPASRGIPLVFVENVGQFDKRIHFQARSGNTTIFLTDDALWLSLTELSTKPDPIQAMEMPEAIDTGTVALRGVNLRLSFVGANPHPHLEPFDERDAQISFFTGSDRDQWHTHVPVWGGVRYVELYPGVDLEITSQNGQLAQRLVVREHSSLRSVRLRVEGADELALEGNYLRITTLLDDVALPLLTVEGTTLEVEPAISMVNGAYEVSTPIASQPPLAFTARSASNSALQYSTYLGGNGEDRAYAIALDSAGNVYLIGQTSSTDFPVTLGAYDRFYGGDPIDVFVTKLSADGRTLVYSTYLGGNGEDAGNGITVDSTGNVYITGKTYSTDFPATTDALDTTLSGGRDAFAAKLNAAGDDLTYSTYLGGNSWDYGFCIAIDDTGNAYVGGFTHGSFPITFGAAQTTFGGSGDGFAVKLSPDGSTLLYSTYLGGYSWEGIAGIAVDSVGDAYLASGTHSTDFPTTPGAWDRTCDNCQPNVSTDGAVTKLSADGSTFIYSTLIGGADASGTEEFRDIAIDGAGNAYLTGHTSSNDFPTTTDVLQPGIGGGVDDAVLVKLNADGSDLLYSTYLGGNGADRGYSIAIDGDGNAYITGYTGSTDLTTVDPLQASNAGGYDAFVSKVNNNGSALLYSTYLGGSGDENCYAPLQGHAAIALGGAGDIYLTGFTESTDFPTTPSAYGTSYNGGTYDVFLTKLTPGETQPSLVYSTYLGGSCEDRGYDIAVDNTGNVYVTGQIASVDFPTTPGAYDTSSNDDPPGCQISDYTGDAFIAKLSADGSTLLYSTYLGGNSEDAGYGIAVDSTGSVYLAGKTYSVDFPTTPSALDANLNGGRDAFVAKLNAAGDDLIYSTYLGGDSWEYGLDIAVDGHGYAYVTGFTHGGFPTTPDVIQPTPVGSTDPFVVKLNLDGSDLVYSTYLGGSSNDGGDSIAVDSSGSAYVTGGTSSPDFPTANPLQPTKAGGTSDAFVAKLNTDGSSLVYSTYLGGSTGGGGESGYGIVIDHAGNAYVTGATDASDFPTVNPLQPTYGGGELDAFLSKLNDDGSALVYSTYLGGSGLDRSLGIGIDAEHHAYMTGYTSSPDLTTVHPLQAAKAGGYDVFLVKVNYYGNALLYSTYLGGSGDENLYNPGQGDAGLAVHSTGKVYLTGLTSSTDFPTTPGALDTTFNGGDSDVFVTSLDLGPFREERMFLPLIVKQ